MKVIIIKKWINRQTVLSFILGMMLFSCIGVNAENISKSIPVIFNSVIVRIDDKVVAGDNLLYGNNVYIRADKVAENINKSYTWNKEKNSIDIKNKQLQNQTTQGLTPLNDYRKFYLKIDDVGLYSFELSPNLSLSSAYIKDNEYYFDKGRILDILELLSGNYKILNSENPYLKGVIGIGYKETKLSSLFSEKSVKTRLEPGGKLNYSIITKTVYTGINTANETFFITSKIDQSKTYEFSYKPNMIGCISYRSDYVMNAKEIAEHFGYVNRLNFELDNDLKAVIIEIISAS